MNDSGPTLLQRQQHENLTDPALQRLERFADEGSGTMDGDAADIDGLRLQKRAEVDPICCHVVPERRST